MKRLVFWLCTILVVTAFTYGMLVASDRPKNAALLNAVRASKKTETDIPKDAIYIKLPTVEQPNDYSCGAAALRSICKYYGVGEKTYTKFEEKVHSHKENGTSYEDMIKYANSLGLDAKAVPNMKPEDLKKHIVEGRPVICSIQAYGSPEDYEKDESGHFVVAIGFDDKNFYFMDSAIPAEHQRRGYLPKEEFYKRWHDNEAKINEPANPIKHLGIVITPKPGHTGLLLQAIKIP